MKKLFILFAAVVATVAISCKDSENNSYAIQKDVQENTSETVLEKATVHPGKKLLEQQCYVCHNPTTGHDGRIAPPMVAVKSHYITDDISKKDFADAIWNFVEKPTPQKSKMRGAVNRFNLMPYQPFNEKEIRLIADYMYEYKIDEPEWFKEHIEEESKGKMQYRNDGKKSQEGSDSKAETPAERGLAYALSTKKELGKNLMGTIQKKGTKEAVTFCNVKAYPITDSMAVAQNAKIKRVSDKPRNPNNQANTYELSIIEKFKKAVANKESYEPISEVINGTNQVYYPITTNSMCLQCHGSTEKDIDPLVWNTISKLYPQDKATGYDVNEVRGIWAIEFEEIK